MEIMNSWMLEGFQKGFQEGFRKGFSEGFQQGRCEEAQYIVLRQLELRLGTLSAAQEKRVGRLSLWQTEDLAEALLDFTSRRDLNTWLNTHK